MPTRCSTITTMLECPKCHGAAMTRLRKLCLGPAAWTACKMCGAKVTVPWWAMLAVLPLLVGMVPIMFWPSRLLTGVCALVVGSFISLSLHLRVPLTIQSRIMVRLTWPIVVLAIAMFAFVLLV